MERAMEADHFGTGTMAGPRTPMGSASPTLAAAAQHAAAPAGQSMPRIFLEKPVSGWVGGAHVGAAVGITPHPPDDRGARPNDLGPGVGWADGGLMGRVVCVCWCRRR